MSVDTMNAHDEGVEEARRIVRTELSKHFVRSCDCDDCREWKRAHRRILAALTRAKASAR